MGIPVADLARVDIVIPVLNDADALAQLLPQLLLEWPSGSIRVVDGGSRDESSEVAGKYGVAFLNGSGPSRARQMNAGAALGHGNIILFLHADTHLPKGAGILIEEAISSGAVGGAFSRRFDSGSLFLRLTCLAADCRGKWFGAFLGDQAIFATREAFDNIGGFPDQPQFEDFEFSRRLSRAGRTVLLSPPVISSGRRFQKKGPILQTLADLVFTIRYLRRGRKIF